MKLFLFAITLLALSGCAADNVKDVLSNLDKDCVRHYAGSAATGVPGSATVTFQIDCQPSGVTPPPVVNPAAAPVQPAPGVVITPLPAAPSGQLPPPATKPPGA